MARGIFIFLFTAISLTLLSSCLHWARDTDRPDVFAGIVLFILLLGWWFWDYRED